jgi:hypothetical protein
MPPRGPKIDLKFSEQVTSCPMIRSARVHQKTGLLTSNPVNSCRDVPGGSAIHFIGPEAFRPPVTRSLAFSVKIDIFLSKDNAKTQQHPS